MICLKIAPRFLPTITALKHYLQVELQKWLEHMLTRCMERPADGRTETLIMQERVSKRAPAASQLYNIHLSYLHVNVLGRTPDSFFQLGGTLLYVGITLNHFNNAHKKYTPTS